jgi:hypothetical protein
MRSTPLPCRSRRPPSKRRSLRPDLGTAFADPAATTAQSVPRSGITAARSDRDHSSPRRRRRQASRQRSRPIAKYLRNFFATLPFTAALAAAPTPAPAQEIPDIQQNETCQQKVGWRSWHLCGAVPADGHITYENVGIHGVTVFTTGPDGIQCEPPTDNFPDSEVLEECGALQVHEDLPVNGTSQTDVATGELVYIGRSDNTISRRTSP